MLMSLLHVSHIIHGEERKESVIHICSSDVTEQHWSSPSLVLSETEDTER